ncbi:DUF7519 family protein [Natronosalvus vescus]|uniref:DUF7519 family protein n=1 Tax=Natronosalvus vescus TaxID=2953881 RepID=UPI002090862D|nr:hypothetical protein [Natronosalvus vescus]
MTGSDRSGSSLQPDGGTSSVGRRTSERPGSAAIGGEGESGGSGRVETLQSTLLTLGSRATTGVLEAIRGGLAQPTASDVAAFVCTIVVCLVVGGSLIGARLAAVATGAGIGAALAATLLASRNPLRRAVGGAIAVPVAALVATPITLAWAFAIGIAGFGPFAAITVWSLIFAALAGTLISWDYLGDGGARRASTGATLALIGVVIVLLARILPEAGVREHAGTALSDATALAIDLVIYPGSRSAVLSFFALLFVAAALTMATVEYIPFERLAPPDRRDVISTGIGGVKRMCSVAIKLSLGAVFVAILAPAFLENFHDVPFSPQDLRGEVPAPLGEWVATLLTSSGLRYLLIAVVGVVTLLVLAEWIRRALRRGLASVLVRLFAPMVGGAVVTLSLAYVLTDPGVEATLEAIIRRIEPETVAELLLAFPTFALVVGLLVVALGMLSSLLFTVSMLRTFRILPARAIGAALAAIGIFGLALSLSVIGQTETAIWTAAAAFVVWDIGEYADGMRTELGRDAATMRAEVVHAAAAVLTGAGVALATLGLYRWVVTDAPIVERWLAGAALGTGLLAVVLVAWALRK